MIYVTPLSGGCKASHEESNEDGELVWTKSTQGIVLGGLYWGYLLLQLPAQRIMEYFSCKKVAFSTILLMSLLTIVIPVASDVSPWLVMAIRVVQGLTSALSVPAIYCVWAEWGPPLERATMVTICYSGLMIANAVVYPTSGLLCQYGFAGGWPSVFYVYGILGVVWCIMWLLIFYETPEEHPRIDPREREYIVQSIAKAHGAAKRGAIPWRKLFTSLPVWAVILGNVGFNFPFFMLLAVLPRYMREVLKFDIESNGYYCMVPFITLFVITNVYRPICSVLKEKRILSVTAIRKVSAVLGTFVPGVLYVVISFLDCDYAMVVVVLMSFAIGFSGANMQGYYINPYDIAPQYATAILCLGNTASVATGIVSPYIVAALTVDKTREEWQQVYFLTAGIVTACMVFYLVFGSGTQLEWTKTKQPDTEVDAKEQKSARTLTVDLPSVMPSCNGNSFPQ